MWYTIQVLVHVWTKAVVSSHVVEFLQVLRRVLLWKHHQVIDRRCPP